MADNLPTLSEVRGMTDSITKPVGYTVRAADGSVQRYSGVLKGACDDTIEGIAELAGQQTSEKIVLKRKKVVLADGAADVAETHTFRPSKLRDVYLRISALAEAAKKTGSPAERAALQTAADAVKAEIEAEQTAQKAAALVKPEAPVNRIKDKDANKPATVSAPGANGAK